jgi:hypothetical protein
MVVQVDLFRTFFDRTPVHNLTTLVGHYAKGEFESPFRSTVPLLALLRDGRSIFQEMVVSCGFPARPDLHFEFKVSPQLGRGKASHTDLMMSAGNNCMAIEAKWTEPPYPTVSAWMRPHGQESENRKKVIAGWLHLLQPFAAKPLRAEHVGTVAYQTIHRAASACFLGKRPHLSYLQFVSDLDGDSTIRDERIADLDRLRSALGWPDGFPFRLIEIDIEPTREFGRLAPLQKGVAQTATAVKQALISSVLFTFKSMRTHILP